MALHLLCRHLILPLHKGDRAAPNVVQVRVVNHRRNIQRPRSQLHSNVPFHPRHPLLLRLLAKEVTVGTHYDDVVRHVRPVPLWEERPVRVGDDVVPDVVPGVPAHHADVLLCAAQVEVFVRRRLRVGVLVPVVLEEQSDTLQLFLLVVHVDGVAVFQPYGAPVAMVLERGPLRNPLLNVPLGLLHRYRAHGLPVRVKHVDIVVHGRFHRDQFHLGLSFPLLCNFALNVRG
mmetsp:Transcript_26634/g.56660  ORF Transcript_26634/g.56660 Transcript_26634/m.56660 type:complete len:231 (-) Transcript_26634:369-1061(-)